MVVAAGAVPTVGAPMLTMDFPAPQEYIPGGPITFDVLLTGAQDLSAYFVELVLEADVATVGSGADAWFEEPAAPDSASNYVFIDDNILFTATAGMIGGAHVLSMGDDIWPTSVNTAAGVNDLIATVTVSTVASMTGNLYISLDAETLELDDVNGDPIPDFAALKTTLVAADPTEFTEVPEPTSVLLLALGTAALLRRRRRTPASCT